MSQKLALSPQQEKFSRAKQSGLALYKELVAADSSWLHFLYYEFSLGLFSNLPGIFGYGFRSMLYPGLFREHGGKGAFGRGIVLRNPRAVTLGKGVLIDDYATLDARGGSTLSLGESVAIGRMSSLVVKGGAIVLEAGVNVGSYSRIASESSVHIGESTLIAAYAYIGPGNHQAANDGQAMIERETEKKGGVQIGRHCWIGTKATILDGVRIGDGAIVGAHSLVREDVPAGAIAVGTPAKILSPESVS
jgi:acetyltransferase-like isoleucine patch superfamily enzyme